MSDPNIIWGTGRRKTAVARVRILPGTGTITVNGRKFEEFFPTDATRNIVLQPFEITGNAGKFDVFARVNGGGPQGQAGAIRLGIARALKQADETLDPGLRDAGMLTRDARMKERKKYGQAGARRKFQFSKR